MSDRPKRDDAAWECVHLGTIPGHPGGNGLIRTTDSPETLREADERCFDCGCRAVRNGLCVDCLGEEAIAGAYDALDRAQERLRELRAAVAAFREVYFGPPTTGEAAAWERVVKALDGERG